MRGIGGLAFLKFGLSRKEGLGWLVCIFWDGRMGENEKVPLDPAMCGSLRLVCITLPL